MQENNPISAYVINLPDRKDRLEHITEEFKDRPEFNLIIVKAFKDEIGARGLWNTISHIVKEAKAKHEEFVLICEDDHQFTKHYSIDQLLTQVKEAAEQKCDFLAGGISGGFRCAFPVGKNRFWVDGYYCNQFIVLFNSIFEKILSHRFDPALKVDLTISNLTANKMVIHPFISTQKYFGYSDVTKHNEENIDWAVNRFDRASASLEELKQIFYYYYEE
jgi:GR25 family glycosyltransferase involved in LPS biosynthesis